VKSLRALRIVAAVSGVAALTMTSVAFAQWKPTKPINVIVRPGGATDDDPHHRGRPEAALGQKIVVLNQPGASGLVGTRRARSAEGRLHVDLGRAQGPGSCCHGHARHHGAGLGCIWRCYHRQRAGQFATRT
jgi:hypothetical protein